MARHTLIIAEAGVNHNGDIQLAKQLIDVAALAGVDFVKFQTFKTEKLVSKLSEAADYQKKNTGDDNMSQFDMLKKLELDEATHVELKEYCAQKGVKFLSTAFDLDSADMLDELGIEVFKIPSGEITNLPYLKKIASFGKKTIVSTGMCDMKEVEDAVNVLLQAGLDKQRITVLHCNTEYPTPMEDVNLMAMLTIGEKLGVNIGYSDHTLGIEVPIAAVAMGATVIEKHFTLDRNMKGPDHKASLEPEELVAMVKGIRNIEKALGDGEKKATKSELKNKVVARKSIHLIEPLESGEIITIENLEMKRPGDGISPMQMDDVIGKTVNKNVPAGHKLLKIDINS